MDRAYWKQEMYYWSLVGENQPWVKMKRAQVHNGVQLSVQAVLTKASYAIEFKWFLIKYV